MSKQLVKKSSLEGDLPVTSGAAAGATKNPNAIALHKGDELLEVSDFMEDKVEMAFVQAQITSKLRQTEHQRVFESKKTSMGKIVDDLDSKSEIRLNQVLFKESRNSFEFDDEDQLLSQIGKKTTTGKDITKLKKL